VTDDLGVHKYNSGGVPIKSWTATAATGIAADPSGNLWVGIGLEMQKFSPAGTLLDKFGAGKINSMSKGDGVTVGPEGAIWVANSGANEIQKWVPTP
jgi:streptogramin lyase